MVPPRQLLELQGNAAAAYCKTVSTAFNSTLLSASSDVQEKRRRKWL
jgi:hypothetical protein